MQKTIAEHVLIVWNSTGKNSVSSSSIYLPEASNNLVEIVSSCVEMGIRVLTVHLFPNKTEHQSLEGICQLPDIIDGVLERNWLKLKDANVRVRVFGDFQILPDEVVDRIKFVIEETQSNTGVQLNFLVNYGGKAEIIEAIRSVIREGFSQKNMNESVFRSFLLIPDFPEPDLEIVTGGDYRIQDTLIWQSTYAEICVADTPWFAFDNSNFMEAIDEYTNIERRFGVLPNQT